MKETKRQKVILVTGGAGFIGSHLIEVLVKNPSNRVFSLDNYFTGTKDNHVKGASYIEGHTKDIGTLVTGVPDIIYHLGEYSRVEKSFDDMPLVWGLNVSGTFAVLEFCRKSGSKLVYAGSSTKFGDGGFGRDQSPYAWTKASNTELVRNYGTWFGLPYAITYFYNVYGPRERAGMYGTVIEIFLQQYKKWVPLTVVSPGTQRRNFTHVNDIVEGLIRVGEKGEGDDYGIGTEESYSILDIARLFNVPIQELSERKGNRMNTSVDCSKTKQLGWRAKENVREYIRARIAS